MSEKKVPSWSIKLTKRAAEAVCDTMGGYWKEARVMPTLMPTLNIMAMMALYAMAFRYAAHNVGPKDAAELMRVMTDEALEKTRRELEKSHGN